MPKAPLPPSGSGPAGLTTVRLTIRPAALPDAREVFDAFRDPEISRWLLAAPARRIEDTVSFLRVAAQRQTDGTGWHGVVRDLADGRFLGIVGLDPVLRGSAAVTFLRAEIGWWFVPSARGRGIATEAAAAVLLHAFRGLGLGKATARVFAGNAPSLRMLSRLGFHPVGTARRDVCRDGVWHDVVHAELLRDDLALARLDRLAAGGALPPGSPPVPRKANVRGRRRR